MRQYVLVFSSILWLFACHSGPKDVQLPPAGEPFGWLSEYGFFRGNMADLTPSANVLPYELNTPLFTDYAQKARFIWMPDGTAAKYVDAGLPEFPVGTVLIKNFFYYHDERTPENGKRIIETRLLVHQPDGWKAHSYVWNEEQTDAKHDLVGDIIPIDWTDSEGRPMHANYIIPNRNQCKGCHSYDGELMPIGPKARNLNRNFDYTEGSRNQLEKWAESGLLSDFDPSQPALQTAVWNDPKTPLHDRALAYLDVNCGHCHNPHGPGGTTGLNLVYGAPADLNLGINKPPVAAGRATGGHAYSIVPGHPEMSIMVHRMASAETGVMMPEIGRTMVHEEGVALISQWISEMNLD